MFKNFINNISGEVLFFSTLGFSMLFPYSTPIWLFSAMIITCCKSPNFLDEEFNRREAIKMLYEDEDFTDEEEDTLDNLSIEELRERIKHLNNEIAEYRCENLVMDNTELIKECNTDTEDNSTELDTETISKKED